jgi:hypothetical protein
MYGEHNNIGLSNTHALGLHLCNDMLLQLLSLNICEIERDHSLFDNAYLLYFILSRLMDTVSGLQLEQLMIHS